MNDFFVLLSNLAGFGDILRGILGLTSIYGIYSCFEKIWPKKVELSVGSFSIKRKDFSVQNVTNLVSDIFYGGGSVPPEIRQEIFSITNPKVKNIKYTKKNLKKEATGTIVDNVGHKMTVKRTNKRHLKK